MTFYLRYRTVYGLDLRYVLTATLLEAGEPLTVSELVERVERNGFVIAGRPSKTVSDALRWEVGRGRVLRSGRGLYEAGSMPRATRRRIVRKVAMLRDVVCDLGDLAELSELPQTAEPNKTTEPTKTAKPKKADPRPLRVAA